MLTTVRVLCKQLIGGADEHPRVSQNRVLIERFLRPVVLLELRRWNLSGENNLRRLEAVNKPADKELVGHLDLGDLGLLVHSFKLGLSIERLWL